MLTLILVMPVQLSLEVEPLHDIPPLQWIWLVLVSLVAATGLLNSQCLLHIAEGYNYKKMFLGGFRIGV